MIVEGEVILLNSAPVTSRAIDSIEHSQFGEDLEGNFSTGFVSGSLGTPPWLPRTFQSDQGHQRNGGALDVNPIPFA